jgi:hypothetical protein
VAAAAKDPRGNHISGRTPGLAILASSNVQDQITDAPGRLDDFNRLLKAKFFQNKIYSRSNFSPCPQGCGEKDRGVCQRSYEPTTHLFQATKNATKLFTATPGGCWPRPAHSYFDTRYVLILKGVWSLKDRACKHIGALSSKALIKPVY